MLHYDLSGRVSLGVIGDECALTSVAPQLDPFRPRAAAPCGTADVVLEFDDAGPGHVQDIQNPARDAMTTYYDGRALSLMIGGRACTILRCPDGAGLVLRCQPKFPVGPLFRTVIRPALQTTAVGHDAVAVHSAAVEIDGRAVLVAGWSESGKTETALALMEAGAGWVSDKWTLLGADGDVSAFPVNVGVRRWVLPHLPRLAEALPRAARTQMALAGAAARMTRPLRRRTPHGGALGAVAVAAERAIAAADRAALTPGEIRTAYDQGSTDAARRVPLGTLVMLTTVPGPEIAVEPVSAQWAAARLALTGAYERSDWYLLQDRLRYADPSLPGDGRERAVDEERRLLGRALVDTGVLHVRAPFPVDPRRVADAVREAM